ncbi:predicted protein [Nematostella vectensis]|uniref:Metalloendopeptidase n=1 Tax=Nematostella vectensis TaxID=45351 RepID=A7RVC7_NEMVE|nr:predicted protein [Nematostella vectensis]|eukprot:XP_001636612.1 predicted protein [Nematostella vectensis]
MFLLFCLCSTVFLSAAQSVPLPATGFKRKITEDFNSGQEVFPDVSIADEIIRANQADDIDLFEGDIVLAATHHSQPAKRSAPRHRASLWLTKKIPYEMDASLTDTLLATNIAIAIGEFNNLTCVQWEPRRTEVNWVRFVQTNGCWSAVGRQYWQKGAQEVSLSRGCSNPGAILHEMMHAIGLWHEQSRPDRDQHVEVMWENILPGKEQNFEKYRHDRVDAMGLRYDFNSLLHYGNRAFGANGKQTLQALGNPLRPLGGQSRPSQGDVIKIDTLYDCKGAYRIFGIRDLRDTGSLGYGILGIPDV